MANFINPLQIRLQRGNSGERPIIIEPQLEESASGWEATGSYKIYKDSFGDQTELITQPDPAQQSKLADNANPDYLGYISFNNDQWQYVGELLDEAEQEELAAVIGDHEEPAIDPGP